MKFVLRKTDRSQGELFLKQDGDNYSFVPFEQATTFNQDLAVETAMLMPPGSGVTAWPQKLAAKFV